MKSFAFKPAWTAILTTALALTLLFAACPSTTNSDPKLPAAVTGFNAAAGNGRITLTWTDPAGVDFDHVEITFSPVVAAVTQPISVGKGAQTRIVTGLANDTPYTFTIIVVYASGEKSAGVTKTETPKANLPNDVPPAGVTNLFAAPGNGLVILTWTDPADTDLATIKITFSPIAAGVTQPISVNKDVQSATITGLANNTPYTFIVVAVDAAGQESPGETKTATPAHDETPPANVAGLVAEAGNGRAILTWTDPADPDLASIEITFSPAATGVTQPIIVARGTQIKTITGLANDTTYTFTVKAVDASDNWNTGAGATATPNGLIENDETPPANVTNLAAAAGDRQATLTWANPADPDLAFIEITFSPGAIGVAQPIIVAKGIQSRTITGLANDTAYTFTVIAVDTSDNRNTGAGATATPKDTTAPANVSGLFATPGDGQATLTWTDPADSDLATIEITFSPAAAGVAQPISVDRGANAKTVTGLANETAYTFTVIAVDLSNNKSSGSGATVTPSAPPSGDETVAELIAEGSKRLVDLSLDSAVQYYESAYAKNNNDPAAIVYSSIAKLASIANDQKVRDLMRSRFGISSYPGTIDALVSGSWLVEYPDEQFVSWYYDDQNSYSIQWYGKHPQTGGLFGGSVSADSPVSSPDWVLDESAYTANGPGYYRQEFVKRSYVWAHDVPRYNYDSPIEGYYDPDYGSVTWRYFYEGDEEGRVSGYYYGYGDNLTFLSSEWKYNVESYYDDGLRVYLNWFEEGSSWDLGGEIVSIEKTGYHYQKTEYKLIFVSNTPIYETRGYSLFPAFETPQWIEENGNYDASLNSGNIPGAATMQLLLFTNLIDKNNNGLNNLLDDTLDAVFGANFEEAATRVATLTYDQTVFLDEAIVDAFGLTEIFEGDIVITKVEMELLIASIRLVKATLEWINAYDWNTDLNFLKIDWVNGPDDLDSLLDKIGASALPLKNNFLKGRNNNQMAASKADFIKAIHAAVDAYDNLDKEQLIPPGVKDEIKNRGWIRDGLIFLEKAMNSGGTFWIPGSMPVGGGWGASSEETGAIGINLGRLFTPGYLSLDKLIENSGGTPAIYGFPRDGGEPVAISSKAAIASYEAFGFKFITGSLYGSTGVVVKIDGADVPAEYVAPLFSTGLAEVLWDLYNK